jgi:hypothetical protein
MILGKKMNRRTMLRGMGASLALPFLDAMTPAMAAPAAKMAPTRLAFCYVPNGIIMENFMPSFKTDREPLPTEFPRVLKAMEPFHDQMLMFDGLTCNGGRSLGDGPGDHARAAASYLTASHPKKTSGKDIFLGTSVDQVIAKHIGEQTRLASIELGSEEGQQAGSCDSGYSCAYSNSVSWRTPTSPMPPDYLPRSVFERMFGSADQEKDPVKRAQQRQVRGSVMDAVLESAKSISAQVGPADRQKLDEYIFAVRDIEKRIEKIEKEGDARPPLALDAPAPGLPDTFKEHSELMFDMMFIAFQSNLTRVITYLMAVEGSNRTYREIGVPDGHHGITHHMGDAKKVENVTKINEFHMRQFAYFIQKLKATHDGEGTLLDHSIVVYGSGISDGNHHVHDHVPTLILGGGNGTLKTGRFVRYPDETPLGNLWAAMLPRMGVPMEAIGDSNGELPGLI